MRRPVTVVPDDLARLSSRRYGGTAPAARSEAQRDRDRILYSSAFLRLGHVTQVAAPEVGHIFHSRLTHSLKVAQVARRLAERLKTLSHRGKALRLVALLDPDAVEAAALAHDLGHPPFGHLAEQELNRASRGFGGFGGFAQSFRILTRLAIRTVEQRGLNLTRQTLSGVLKYPWLRDTDRDEPSKKWGAYDSDRAYFEWAREDSAPRVASLEARIMDWADDVTYAVHDMDDFYRAGLIPLDRVRHPGPELDEFERHRAAYDAKEGTALKAAAQRVLSLFNVDIKYQGRADERANLRAIGSFLITRYLNAFRVVNAGGGVAVDIDSRLEEEVSVLKRLTWCYIIERPSLATIQHGQRKMIRELVEIYTNAIEGDRRMFPPALAERLDSAETDDARERRRWLD